MSHEGETTSDEAAEERAHFRQIVATFRQYRQHSLSANNRRRKDFYSLSPAHQQLLKGVKWHKKLGDVDDAILANADFLEEIVADTQIFSGGRADPNEVTEETEANGPSHSHGGDGDGGHVHAHEHRHTHHHATPERRLKVNENDMEKLRSTLKQFVRDWSEEGKPERDECYGPMLEALAAHFSNVPIDERSDIRVLVPGAGLGRLTWEVINMGFSCQGNEFSYFMLLSSFFILNRTQEPKEFTIYPHIHSFSNFMSTEPLLRSITIPDVLPSERPEYPDFSQVAGDFEEVYGPSAKESQEGQWDAIMTCFFIDTAKNVIRYLEIIHSLLAPGGVWINLGPLLWHFENNTTRDVSIELDLQEVKEVAAKIGFTLSNEKILETTYVGNPESMLRHVYKVAFWTAQKQ